MGEIALRHCLCLRISCNSLLQTQYNRAPKILRDVATLKTNQSTICILNWFSFAGFTSYFSWLPWCIIHVCIENYFLFSLKVIIAPRDPTHPLQARSLRRVGLVQLVPSAPKALAWLSLAHPAVMPPPRKWQTVLYALPDTTALLEAASLWNVHEVRQLRGFKLLSASMVCNVTKKKQTSDLLIAIIFPPCVMIWFVFLRSLHTVSVCYRNLSLNLSTCLSIFLFIYLFIHLHLSF